jgi:hypothetical protein
MTTLLFVKEFIREKLGADNLQLMFDEDNLTNEEEIIEQSLIENVYFKIVSSPKFGGGPSKSEESKDMEPVRAFNYQPLRMPMIHST